MQKATEGQNLDLLGETNLTDTPKSDQALLHELIQNPEVWLEAVWKLLKFESITISHRKQRK